MRLARRIGLAAPAQALTNGMPVSLSNITPLILAEYARQSAHLAHGIGDRTGEVVLDGVTQALWCLRTDPDSSIRSLFVTVFASATDQPQDRLPNQLLGKYRPDCSIIRYVGGEGARRRVRLHGGSAIFAPGLQEIREILPFSREADAFFASLGKRSRMHIRSSLRDFERKGLRHNVTAGSKIELTPEILSLAARNLPNPTPAHYLSAFVRDANGHDAPFQSEMRSTDGNVISIIIGYYAGGHALILCQLNPSDAPKVGQAGCSLLHRALLIRRCATEGMQGLIFVNGCNGGLRPYCRRVVVQTVFSVALHPLSWIRCLRHLLTRPYLRSFLVDALTSRHPVSLRPVGEDTRPAFSSARNLPAS